MQKLEEKMSNPDGYYYLHSHSKDLIWKRYLDNDQVVDFQRSNMVQAYWPIYLNRPDEVLKMLIEAEKLGANSDRILSIRIKLEAAIRQNPQI